TEDRVNEEPPRIKPHPDFDVLTEAELKAEVERIRDQIKFAHELQLPDMVGWLGAELSLCFAALRKLTVGQASVKQLGFWPESLTAADFLEQTPEDPDRWLWEDCLTRGSSSMLVAKPKVGKSTFAAALALAISRGHPFLNRGVQKG